MNVQFLDVSDWLEMSWLSSGGTRAKMILQSPDEKEWYFKCSEKKEAKDGKPEKYYKYEFWSEVIAYQIGQQLGLDILRYDVAYYGNQIGCISPKMNKTDEEQLIELGRFMVTLNPDFLPENYATRKEYTFQLLEQTIEGFELQDYWLFIFQTIIFDALIGNTDRHQENWALLVKNTMIAFVLPKLLKEEKHKKKALKIHSLLDDLHKNNAHLPEGEKTHSKLIDGLLQKIELLAIDVNKPAPIYDSGSSLGRELTEKRIGEYHNDEAQLHKYVNKGISQLHWNKQKISHFDFLKNLLMTKHEEVVRLSSAFLKKWDSDFISKIIMNIDHDLPQHLDYYKIPDARKTFIIKVLTLRYQKLKELFYGV